MNPLISHAEDPVFFNSMKSAQKSDNFDAREKIYWEVEISAVVGRKRMGGWRLG